jgi:hypothetical protein
MPDDERWEKIFSDAFDNDTKPYPEPDHFDIEPDYDDP